MPILIDIKSTIDEPIRFFLEYPKCDRESFKTAYKNVGDFDGYYDKEKGVVMIYVEERIDEEITQTTLEEFSFEEYLEYRFEQEKSNSMSLIKEIYKNKGKSKNQWTFKRLLKAFLENYNKYSKHLEYPESELLPNALIEIVKYALKLYDKLLSDPLVSKVKEIIANAEANNIDTGFQIRTEHLVKIKDFNQELIRIKFVDSLTVTSQWNTFFRGLIPQSRINIIAQKGPNTLWHFLKKLEHSKVMKSFPKQQFKHIPKIFTINNEEIKPDFYKNHNYLNKKIKNQLDQAIDKLDA